MQAYRKGTADPGRKPALREMSVSDLVDRWKTEQAGRSRGYRALTERVARVLVPHMGRLPVKSVRPRDLIDLVPRIPTPAAGLATRNQVRTALHRLFQLAVELGELDRNPVSWRPERVHARPRPAFRAPELRALLEAARSEPNLYAMIVLAATTGARHGELVALRGRDLDRAAGELTLYSPKTGALRVLRLPPEVIRILPDVGLDERLFPRDLRGTFNAVLRRAGLAGRRLCFHSLRHTWTTISARAGTPTAVLREVLGHTSLSTTERYAQRIGAPIPVGGVILEALGRLSKPSAPPAS